jgi:hypothetical protein
VEQVVRVPAVYLNSVEVSILAFLPFIRINKLRSIREGRWFNSRHLSQSDPFADHAGRPPGNGAN